MLLADVILVHGEPSARDKATAEIDACLNSRDVASRECTQEKSAINVLIQLFHHGDKSVLPTLLRVEHLGNFYAGALISDPEGFLRSLSLQPEHIREGVALSISGGVFGLRDRQQFEMVRSALLGIPNDSPVRAIAQECQSRLDVENAFFLQSYFPPQTLGTGPGSEFMMRWYSKELAGLEERPLWPGGGGEVYRFTWLRSFSVPVSVSLTFQADGEGLLVIHSSDREHNRLIVDRTLRISKEQGDDFRRRLGEAGFWRMPARDNRRGFDGSEWILEGADSGRYHLVTRWSAEESLFGQTAWQLISFAGYEAKP
jgi:hypothetical protein